MKAYGFNKENEIVIGTEVESMDEMRKLAKNWNREEKRTGMVIEFVGDQPVLAHGTKVSAIY